MLVLMLDLEDWELREAREWLNVAINKGGVIHLEKLAEALSGAYGTRVQVGDEPDIITQRWLNTAEQI